MRLRVLLALGGLATVLLALLAVEYRAEALQDAGRSAGSGHRAFVHTGVPASATAEPSNTVHALADTILKRPLFRSDRRSPPPADSAAAVVSTLPRLSGVLVTSFGKSLIFAGGTNSKPIVVTEGGRIGSYRVQSIGAGEAIVAGPDGIRTLRPAFGEPAAGGRPVPAVAQALAQPSILDQLRSGLPAAVAIPGLSPTGGAPSTAPSSGTPSSSTRQ